MSPLVSVITPTWNRHDVLLNRCIPSVTAQIYDAVEHIVVSDGPDPVLRSETPDHVRFAELSHHDDTARWGHHARLAGIDLAEGEIIAYLDDDNAYRPEHLELLVGVLEADPSADFAYAKMIVRGAFEPYVVGSEPPSYGQIDTSLLVHRRKLLDCGTWLPSLPTIDWDIVHRWVNGGARWAFVDCITVDYFRC